MKLINGDCLKEMDKLISEGVKVDAIITDPPYGTTACRWDSIIPFDAMWERLNKLIKPNGAIVLFGSEPFSSALRMSNIKDYKYDWVWKKPRGTGHLNAKRQPLRDVENISVFYKKQCDYYPQFSKGAPYNAKSGASQFEGYGKDNREGNDNSGFRYPKQVLEFGVVERGTVHPTQKPVALMEYLIKTYTNEGETVLDFTMGSGSTGVACAKTNREFIGIEKDEGYFKIARIGYRNINHREVILTYQQMQTAKSKAIDSILMSIESEIKKTYRFGRDNITGLVKDAYAKHLVGVDSADYYKTLNLYNRLKTMEQEIKGVYIQIGKETRKTVTQGMYTTFDESYLMDRYTTAFFSDAIGKDIKYVTPNPIVREVAVTGDATRLTAIRDTRLRRIAEGMIPPSGDTLTGILVNNLNNELTKTLRVVKQGLINGQSYVKQAQALKETFNGNAYNALRVVRTEGNRLANAGTYLNSEDLKESGVKIRRQWVATLDGRTRDSHQALDGQFEDEDGLFHIHGLSSRYPGDFGDPAEDIACRCTTIDVVQGLEPTLRRGVNPVTGKSDIASYRDYDTWKKQGLK